MKPLSNIQLKFFRYLQKYENKTLPSRREMANDLGLNSHGTIINHIQNLTNLGFISELNGKIKIHKFPKIESETVELAFYGTVSAGQAIFTESEEPQSMIKVLSSLVSNPYTTFTVRVNGDSMINANIQHGDLLIVETTDQIKDGDIVIALIYGSETTCKRFVREMGGFYLKAENPLYDDIRSEEIEIQGVVKKLIREEVF